MTLTEIEQNLARTASENINGRDLSKIVALLAAGPASAPIWQFPEIPEAVEAGVIVVVGSTAARPRTYALSERFKKALEDLCITAHAVTGGFPNSATIRYQRRKTIFEHLAHETGLPIDRFKAAFFDEKYALAHVSQAEMDLSLVEECSFQGKTIFVKTPAFFSMKAALVRRAEELYSNAKSQGLAATRATRSARLSTKEKFDRYIARVVASIPMIDKLEADEVKALIALREAQTLERIRASGLSRAEIVTLTGVTYETLRRRVRISAAMKKGQFVENHELPNPIPEIKSLVTRRAKPSALYLNDVLGQILKAVSGRCSPDTTKPENSSQHCSP